VGVKSPIKEQVLVKNHNYPLNGSINLDNYDVLLKKFMKDVVLCITKSYMLVYVVKSQWLHYLV
jgi:hypothetical protein